MFSHLSKQYLSMFPPKKIDLTGVAEADWEAQQYLLSVTIKHPTSRQYPSAASYRKSVLKLLISEIERGGCDVHDDFYTEYTKLLQERDSELCYKTYTLSNESLITLQESTNLISDGTTGLNTWQAALYMAEWILDNKDLFTGKEILELGSGLGMTGLTVIRQCQPAQFIFSDCHMRVLTLLRQNLERNLYYSSGSSSGDSRLNADQKCHMDCTSTDHIQTDHDQIPDKDIDTCDATRSDNQKNADSENFDNADSVRDHRPQGVLTDTDIVRDHRTQGALADTNKVRDHHLQGVLTDTDIVRDHRTRGVLADTNIVRDHRPSGDTDDEAVTGRHTEMETVAVYPATSSPHVQIWQLDWETIIDSTISQLTNSIDVIIAADVVYDTSIIPALVRFLSCSLRSGRTRCAYIASTIRNQQTRDMFITALEDANITWCLQISPRQQLFYYDRSIPIEIIKLQLLCEK